jgi:myo-inositol-1(or 4)-monophosphatase
MGLIDLPPLGMRYHAVKGAGAFENGRHMTVRPPFDLSEPASLQNDLFAVCSRTVERYELDVPLKPRVIGSAAYNFCLAAAGIAAAALDVTPKVWDIAAGWLLVHEAGGVVVQIEGKPILPLVLGCDYVAISHPQLSAPDHNTARELMHRIKRVR